MSGVGVEDEGDINPRNIDINSTAEKETKDMAGSQNCSMSGEEKSKNSRSSSYRCFIITTSLVVITIICFILSGSYLAVRTKTNTDDINLAGR